MPAADFTFSGDTKHIIITSGVTVVDVQDMYSRWKQWTTESDNSKYVQALRTFGGDPTIPGQFAPRYYFLTNGWRVFVDTGELLTVATNLYTEELDTPYVIVSGSSVSDSNSDAVVVDNGIAESLDYDGVVQINSDIGVSGVAWPIGTIARPVNNLIEAKTIAAIYNISSYRIHGTVDFNVDLNDSVVIGGRIADVVNLQSVNISGTTFHQCVLQGDYNGLIIVEKCRLSNGLSGMSGTYRECGIAGGIHFKTGADATLYNCSSTTIGQELPNLFLNTNVSLAVNGYSGGIGVYNCQSGSSVSLDFTVGRCSLLTGNTGGDIIVAGISTLLDQSSGTTIDTIGLLIPANQAQQQSLNVNTEITKNK